MGLVTNLPFALASGLGINAVVAFDIILGRKLSPEVGMACIVLEGVLALVLVLAGLREAVVRAVPSSLKLAIGVGIGLFITLVGLRDGGIVVNDPATGIGLGDLTTGPALIALAGILVALALSAANVRGSILIGIAASTVLGLIFGVLDGPDALARWPHSHDFSTIGDGLSGHALQDALTWALVPVIFSLFMTDFFDTVGTAYAVTSAGGLLDEKGEVPNIRRLLLVDSAAAAGGGVMGVSSVTTYVESGAGVAEGACTGLASLVTAGLFALTIFFVPLIAVVGQGVAVGKDTVLHPAVAPALVMVGYLMLGLVRGIDWDEPESAVPAFLTIAGIPLTFSISAGIGLGVFGYVVTMLARGRVREVHPIMWALVPLFAAFFAADWLSVHVF
jgi:adenine/guanine/hypoxanthine permease